MVQFMQELETYFPVLQDMSIVLANSKCWLEKRGPRTRGKLLSVPFAEDPIQQHTDTFEDAKEDTAGNGRS